MSTLLEAEAICVEVLFPEQPFGGLLVETPSSEEPDSVEVVFPESPFGGVVVQTPEGEPVAVEIAYPEQPFGGVLVHRYADIPVQIQLTSAQGKPGEQGPVGAQGPEGPQGEQGADSTVAGPPGVTGSTGPPGAVEVYEQPEQPASTTEGAIWIDSDDLIIPGIGPPGPTGATGATGPVGATGPAGADGATGPAGPISEPVSGPQVSQPSGSPWLPAGAILESYPRFQTPTTAQSMITSGTIRVFPIGLLRAGHTATGIGFIAAVAAAGITNSWGGICTVDRVIRAISATSTAATNSNAARTFPFDTSYVPSVDTFLLGFLMYQASTVPTIYGLTQTVQLLPVMSGNANASQTTPLAVNTTLAALASTTPVAYCWLTGSTP